MTWRSLTGKAAKNLELCCARHERERKRRAKHYQISKQRRNFLCLTIPADGSITSGLPMESSGDDETAELRKRVSFTCQCHLPLLTNTSIANVDRSQTWSAGRIN